MIFLGGEEVEGAKGPKLGPKGPTALHRSKKEGGCRPPEPFHKKKFCLIYISKMMKIFIMRRFGWPTATLLLAPAEGWRGPSGPAGDLWPHLK